ncbi:MAG TPA: RDD family protein [Pirellulaceae bacterium]|nr:RDD family protein [Pirellulaceae bacterium]
MPEPESGRQDDEVEQESSCASGFSYEAYKAALLQEDNTMSIRDAEQQLKQDLDVPLSEIRDMSVVAASRTKRFLGSLIDSMLMAVAVTIGFVIFFALTQAGILKIDHNNPSAFASINAVCVMYFPVFALILFQWNMTAVDGQTLAKKLLGMKIVTRSGEAPGFVRGVALRWWVTGLLGIVPFFGLLNALAIFGEQRRCLHDYIAGTYVIDV